MADQSSTPKRMEERIEQHALAETKKKKATSTPIKSRCG
jgi:hypothetical protein